MKCTDIHISTVSDYCSHNKYTHIKWICSIHSNSIARFGREKLLTMRAKSHSASVPNDCSYHINSGHKNYLRPAYERAAYGQHFHQLENLLNMMINRKDNFRPHCVCLWQRRLRALMENNNEQNVLEVLMKTTIAKTPQCRSGQNKRKLARARGERARYATLAEETSPAHTSIL